MPHSQTIQSLLTAAAKAAENNEHTPRIAARAAWVREIMAKLRAAQKKADDAWMAAVAALPDDHSDEELQAIPEPPEQAELDAIRAEIDAVVEKDQWPRELYFGKV